MMIKGMGAKPQASPRNFAYAIAKNINEWKARHGTLRGVAN